MKYLIYHHNDNDGWLAAAIVYKHLQKIQKTTSSNIIQFVIRDYEGREDVSALEWADKIYMVDYCIEDVEVMKRFADKMVWIDHHKSHMYEELQDIKGIRAVGTSGCMLTWKYFYGIANVPWVVELVNDRDIWELKFGDDTFGFQEASIWMRGNVSNLKIYQSWIKLLESEHKVANMVVHGKALAKHMRAVSDKYVEDYSWLGLLDNYLVSFMCAGKFSGELSKSIREKYPTAPIAAVFEWTPLNVIRVTLYRNDDFDYIDVSEIAVKYGGGGHAGAAGFRMDPGEWGRLVGRAKADLESLRAAEWPRKNESSHH